MFKSINSLALLILTSLTLTACGPVTMTIGSSATDSQLAHTAVIQEPGAGQNKIAVIDISGMIINAASRGIFTRGENPVAVLYEKLQAAANDSSVKAVILRINSPGGTVTASDAMYREIMRFKKTTGKPVITMMMDIAASGGYYIACASDHIVAYPSTVTGSIGVIMQLVSMKNLMNTVGIDATAITSGPNKDIASPFKNLSPDQRQILQTMVNDFYATFKNIVKTARPNITLDQFATATDGRVFTGQQALKIGLVDQLGDLNDAFQTAKKKASLKKANLVIYHRKARNIRSPYQSGASTYPLAHNTTSAGTQINFAQFNLTNTFGQNTPFFMYLWQPLTK